MTEENAKCGIKRTDTKVTGTALGAGNRNE